MSSAAIIEEMAKWSDALVRDETRGPRDYISAVRRVSKKIRVGYSILFDLQYRKPKRPDPLAIVRLHEAYMALRERQLQQFEAELAATKTARTSSALVRTALALVRAGTVEDAE